MTKLSVIGAPTSAGAYGPGQERAPGTFRRYGLIAALERAGLRVVDRGNVASADWSADDDHPNAHNVGQVVAVAAELATVVGDALAAGDDLLVIGGDCTIELGTVAGAIRDGARVGLAYIDLDADLNTPATGDGILDWMGVAHLLGIPGTEQALVGLGSRRPLLRPEDVRLLAAENITPPEHKIIDQLDIVVEPLREVVDHPEDVAERTRAWAAAYDRILVHVDIDVLDYRKFPIAHEIRDNAGLLLSQLGRLIKDLHALPQWRALTIAEINPDHAPDVAQSFEKLITTLASALGDPPPAEVVRP